MGKIINEDKIIHLNRGGYIVDSSVGYLQFGSPPETIKDTMPLPKNTPRIFVLPQHTFHIDKGISVAELEFPLYFNHFIRQKKTYIVCTKKQKEDLKVVLRESVFGPEHIDVRNEYPEGEKSLGFPDLKAEIEHFRGGRMMEDLVQFVIFKNNRVKINNVVITKDEEEEVFHIVDGEEHITDVPINIEYKTKYDIGQRLNEPYKPPLLGITCLGPSHGFDPADNTSGFIVWINRHGIMIDPPVNSTEWLKDSNVNPKLINGVILTHCHADHDAGTFQKILEDEKIPIYSTETIMDSFVRKYSSLTGLTRKHIYELFNFHPVVIGTPVRINGAEFYFRYALHSIPSLGFQFTLQNQSFLYTSDHLNDPDSFETLKEKGVLPESRYQDLKNFPWHHNIIYHEGGIPPLHTPISYLNSLPEEIQKKITVYHIAKKDFPTDTHLKLATFGIENTIYPEVQPPAHQEAYAILDALSHVDIFQDFPIAKAKEFLSIVEKVTYKKGDYIIHKDSEGDAFFIILSGNVRIEGLAEVINKSYATYEYFGEASLILNQKRTADVVAATDVQAYIISKNNFLNFIQGSKLVSTFKNLAETRTLNSWSLLSESPTFEKLSSAQKTQLESIMALETHPDMSILIEQDKNFGKAFIIKSGEIEVLKNGSRINVLKRGEFAGEIFALQKNSPSNYTFRAISNIEVFAINRKEIISYIQKNPRAYMNLIFFYEEKI